MIQHYVEAVRRALDGVLELATQWALPLCLGLGFVLVAAILLAIFGRHSQRLQQLSARRLGGQIASWLAVGLLLVAGWAGLKTTQPLARLDFRWRANAEATANPLPDAAPVYQYGPAVAALVERTYERTLTLPPYFLNRIGSQGVGVLAPYLSDPSADNVVRLRDTFRRSGRDVVFTRQTTALEEDPIPFSDSRVTIKFNRLANRAYDAEFEGHYFFQNTSQKARDVHFLFSLPEAGTIRDWRITVGGKAIGEPTDSETYEWKNSMAPGEKQEAIVSYRVVGARTWSYDLGSQRRRVQQFQLDAQTGGDVRFLRGSLQPTLQSKNAVSWQLADVVTAQRLAIVFAESLDDQLYLQALGALPASFVLFLVGVVALGWWFGPMPSGARVFGGLAAFGLGLGATTVLAIYVGNFAGVLVAPIVGAVLAMFFLGRRFLLVGLPLALLPAAFLSAQNSGLIVLGLALATLATAFWMAGNRKENLPISQV